MIDLPSHPSHRVLVVDDEADAREFLSRGLTRHGFEVRTAADGEEACRLCSEPYDVVITDLIMPRMDGFTLLERLPNLAPRAIRIVITSFADKTHVLRALNLGAHYLVEKPFSAQQLVEILERLLQERERHSSMEAIFDARLAALALNERDRQLVLQVLKGLQNREIAESQQLTEQVVKNHLFALYRRLGISSRGELFHLIFPI